MDACQTVKAYFDALITGDTDRLIEMMSLADHYVKIGTEPDEHIEGGETREITIRTLSRMRRILRLRMNILIFKSGERWHGSTRARYGDSSGWVIRKSWQCG